MTINKKLTTVKVPPNGVVIAVPENLPLYKGDETENLLCGECSTILIEGISEQSMLKRFVMPAPLYIKCPNCEQHNYVKVQIETDLQKQKK